MSDARKEIEYAKEERIEHFVCCNSPLKRLKNLYLTKAKNRPKIS
jgi:hypothetical protein